MRRPDSEIRFAEVQLFRDLCADHASIAYRKTIPLDALQRLFGLVRGFDDGLLKAVWADPQLTIYYGEVLREVAKITGNLINSDVLLGEPLQPTKPVFSLRNSESKGSEPHVGGPAHAFGNTADQDAEPGEVGHTRPPLNPTAENAQRYERADPSECQPQIDYIVAHHHLLIDPALDAIGRLKTFKLCDPFVTAVTSIVASVYYDRGVAETLAPPMSAADRSARDALFARVKRELYAPEMDQDQFSILARLLIALNYATIGDHSRWLDKAIGRGRELISGNGLDQSHAARLFNRCIEEQLVSLSISERIKNWPETLRKTDRYAREAAETIDRSLRSGIKDDDLHDRLDTGICWSATFILFRAKAEADRESSAVRSQIDQLERRLQKRWRALAGYVKRTEMREVGLDIVRAFAAADILLTTGRTAWSIVIDLLSRHPLNYEEFDQARNKDALRDLLLALLNSPRGSVAHALQIINILEDRGLGESLRRSIRSFRHYFLVPTGVKKLRALARAMFTSLIDKRLAAEDPGRAMLPLLWEVEAGRSRFKQNLRVTRYADKQIDRFWCVGRDPQAVRRRRIALRGMIAMADEETADWDLSHFAERLAMIAPLGEGVIQPATSNVEEGLTEEDIGDHDRLFAKARIRIDTRIAKRVAAGMQGRMSGPRFRKGHETLRALFDRSTDGAIAANIAKAVCRLVPDSPFAGRLHKIRLAPIPEEKKVNLIWTLPPPLPGNWRTGSLADLGPTVDVSVEGNRKRLEAHANLIVRTLTLPCYANGSLIELGFGFGGRVIASLNLLRIPEWVILLRGLSLPIHQTNETAPVTLDSSEQALAYLKFFCGVTYGEDGAFIPVPDKETLAAFLTDGACPDLPASYPSTLIEPRDEGWYAEMPILYGHGLFASRFTIARSGLIEMISDEPIVSKGLPSRILRFVDNWRVERLSAED